MNKQIRIAMLSNAGGCGKSTIAVNLAFRLAQKNYRVVLMDLDPQGSLSLFCGVERPDRIEESISGVLISSIKKPWHLNPVWNSHSNRVSLVQASSLDEMLRTISDLEKSDRGVYALADALEDYPIEQEVIIFDCPTTLDILSRCALAACTHILIPVQLEYKSMDGATNLISWLFESFDKLRLRPKPEFLGIIPNQFDKQIAVHRQFKEAIAGAFADENIKDYPAIRKSNEFKNATASGLPLGIYRPAHKANTDFNPLLKDIIEVIERG